MAKFSNGVKCVAMAPVLVLAVWVAFALALELDRFLSLWYDIQDPALCLSIVVVVMLLGYTVLAGLVRWVCIAGGFTK
ncbi:hypothetical protein NJH76_14295 [Pseudomonas sp. 2]|uniref:hypothetical protein n=1 Tax=Pseudomonas sp. 2 TaxID=336474 RepID=UPI00209B295D|nr:hypothetical protein [Pseudomonas sp. 2]MCO7530963.1 hypothetical protein [Pseudomonas sp. 2]